MKNKNPTLLFFSTLFFLTIIIPSTAKSVTPVPIEKPSNLSGTWINVDKYSYLMPKVIIKQGRQPTVYVYEKCVPRECKRKINAVAYGQSDYSDLARTTLVMTATYKQDDGITQLIIRPIGKRLQIESLKRFTHSRGGSNYTSTNIFQRLEVVKNNNQQQKNAMKGKRIRNQNKKISNEQLRAKRLAEWHKKNPKKKGTNTTRKIVVQPPLPAFCGNRGVYHGVIKFHQASKSYFILDPRSKSRYILNNFRNEKLLGKRIVFIANRNATYPPGGRQTGAFQSILSNMAILQVVDNRIDEKLIMKKCDQF